MQRALSFKASPPLNTPLPFLLSAPVFALMAALLLLWLGPGALTSRWNGGVLSLTHLFTVGVLANAMAGALLQILPVATGIRAAGGGITAKAVHLLISVGAISLAVAFLRVTPALFGLAVVLLSGGLIWLVVAVATGLWRDRAQASKGSPSILLAVRLALVALLVTVMLGAALAGSMALALPLPRQLTNLHASWGLLGWVGLLVVGISYQVIPMFQVTELYPKPVTRWLALGIFVVLGALTANALLPWAGQRETGLVIGSVTLAGYLIYAAVTFDLLRQRKRPAPDTTTLFWFMALTSLAACLPVWLLHIARVADLSILLGVLFVVGFGWSAVNGMLYKILPFLLWYNTQRDLTVALPVVPKVKQFMPDAQARPQVYAQALALALLILAALWPQRFTHLAAAAMAISTLWLIVNAAQALWLYQRAGQDIAAALAALPARTARK